MSCSYEGEINSFDSVREWAEEHCNPMVREITFENGEELTEEGLPFLIMFHAPDDHDSVREFTEVVKSRLPKERGSVNFITADGHRFAHPLRHLGKTKKDLPVLAFDTFKHMYASSPSSSSSSSPALFLSAPLPTVSRQPFHVRPAVGPLA